MSRSPITRRRAALVVAVLLVAGAAWWTTRGSADPDPQVPAPFQVSVPEWDRILTGDAKRTEETYAALAAVHPGLDAVDARAAAQLAVEVAAADLSAQGRDQWPDYWPPAAASSTAPAAPCTRVRPLAASPARFEVTGNSGRVTDWVKVLVPYAATCGETKYTRGFPGVTYVYLRRSEGADFAPVRDWMIPQEEPDEAAVGADLPEWQLAPVGPCGVVGTDHPRLRTLAAAAFARLCEAAASDGVVLVVESAYRTRAEQASLFADAVEHYGSTERALEWVAYADGEDCASKHCSGTAVNVEPDHAATTWLGRVVGCAAAGADGTRIDPAAADQTCPAGTTPVAQAQLYGFVAPVPRIPGYLEFVLPTGEGSSPVPDCSPSGTDVDQMVAAVFRCRLQRAGVAPTTVEQVVAEALVVSRCASGWNPTARVFAGRYATAEHPQTHRLYTEAGVFALREELVETGWVTGDVLDPVVNINAAASLWLATRGWEQFACATGTEAGLPVGPVLPAYGGPDLPAWATSY